MVDAVTSTGHSFGGRPLGRTIWTIGVISLLLAGPTTAATVDCAAAGDATILLSKAVAGGGVVAVGPGICILSATLMLPSGTRLSGQGIGRTVLRAARGGVFNVIQIGGGTQETGSIDVDVSGMTIDAAATAGGAVPHRADGLLVAFGSTRVRIHDVEVENAADNGIDISGSHVEVSDSFVHESWHNGIYVIGHGNRNSSAAVFASYIRIMRNRVAHSSLERPPGSGTPSRKTWDGIDLDPLHEHCLVQGNTVIDNDILLSNHGTITAGSDDVLDNTISDPDITRLHGVGGIIISANIDGFRVLGNHIDNVTGFGIIVGGEPRHGLISHNVIIGTTDVGILLRHPLADPNVSQDIEISYNKVWAGPKAGGRPAIAVRGVPGVRVIGNDLAPPLDQAGPPGWLDLARAGRALKSDNRTS